LIQQDIFPYHSSDQKSKVFSNNIGQKGKTAQQPEGSLSAVQAPPFGFRAAKTLFQQGTFRVLKNE